MKYKIRHKAIWLVLAATLLPGCSGDDSPNQANNNNGKDSEIRLNAEVWRVMEGTRATTYDGSTITSEPFKCYAYNDGGTSPYLDGLTVSYSAGQWSFDAGRQVWPDNALNFFAHMPADLTGTCYTFDHEAYDVSSHPYGYSEDCPRIVCTGLHYVINSNNDNSKELIYAYTANQSKAEQGASGVTMTFKHPLARVCFKISDASGTAVKINKVTIEDIYHSGTCTFNGTTTTWTPTGTQDSDLVVTCSPEVSSTNNSVGPFLVLPQTFATNRTFTVNATWTDWGNVTKNVSASVNVGSWQPGYSYTYTFTLSKYALKVDVNDKYTEQW